MTGEGLVTRGGIPLKKRWRGTGGSGGGGGCVAGGGAADGEVGGCTWRLERKIDGRLRARLRRVEISVGVREEASGGPSQQSGIESEVSELGMEAGMLGVDAREVAELEGYVSALM